MSKYNQSSKHNTYRGMKIYTFDGVPYIARKDVKLCLHKVANFIKLKNGRYYMKREKYEESWKKYWQVNKKRAMERRHKILKKWRKVARDLSHKRRCEKLIKRLKSASFVRKFVFKSKCYKMVKARISKKKTCPKCDKPDMEYTKGMCRCHLCEDWPLSPSLNAGGHEGPDLLECPHCKYSKRTELRTRPRVYSYYYH